MGINLAQEKRTLQFVGLRRFFPWRYQMVSHRINWQKKQIDGVPFARFVSQWQAHQRGNIIQRCFSYLWYGSRQTVYKVYQTQAVASTKAIQPQQQRIRNQAMVLSPVTTENTSAFVPDEPTSPTPLAANSLTARWQEDKVNIDTFWQDRIQPLLELQDKDYEDAKQIMCEALTSYYRRLAKRYHPDRHSEQQEEATQIFKELTDYIAKKRADLDKDSHLNGFNPTAFADLQRSFDELFQEYQAFWDKLARDIHTLRETMKKSDEMLHENADNLAKMDIKLKQMGIKQQENAIKLEQMGIKQHENAIKLERMGIKQQENAVKLVQMGDKLNKMDTKVASLENNMALIIAKMGLNAGNLKIEMNAKTTAPFKAAPLMAEKPQVAETYQP